MSLAGATPAQLALAEAIAERAISSNRSLRILPFYLDESTSISVRGFADSLLLGVVICQCFAYLRFVKTDKKHIVILVVLSVLCALAASIDVMLWLSDIFVWRYGQFLSFATGKYIYRYMIIDAICTFLVQAFYVDRAYRLHRHWWPLAVLCPLVLGALVSWGVFIKIMAAPLSESIDPSLFTTGATQAWAFATNSLILAGDFAITVVMTYGLHKNKTGWRHTDSHLKGLIIRLFEAQVPALLLAILTLIFWTTKLEIATFLLIIHCKIYTTGVLVTLNFRASPGSSTSMQSYRSGESSGSHALSDISGKNGAVVIQRDTETTTHQSPPHYSKRSKVMDAEQGSTHSDQLNQSQSDFHHPFAQNDPAGWESTAALYPLPSGGEKVATGRRG